MRDITTFVNKNDNLSIRNALYKGEDSELLAYAPLACLLINRHSKKAWKNNSTSPEFCLLEYQLTTCLKQLSDYCTHQYRRPNLRVMALCLQCNPVWLHNDPDLNHFIGTC